MCSAMKNRCSVASATLYRTKVDLAGSEKAGLHLDSRFPISQLPWALTFPEPHELGRTLAEITGLVRHRLPAATTSRFRAC